jgi:hypothetical protein
VTALPQPLKARGKTTARWAQWRKREAALVALRNGGKCEGLGCRSRAEHLHHVFGRRHIIAEPLASHHTMCVALCKDCHARVHLGEKPLLPVLQLAALGRAEQWWKLSGINEPRQLEDQLRADGSWERLKVDAGR